LFTAVPKAHLPFRMGLLECLFGILLLIASVGLSTGPALAASIVLDPGHGGNDDGAGRGGPFAEKRFTLSLARMVAAELSAKHRVELTRSADIELTPSDRAGLANHLRADLMVSLHGAVAPYCSDRSATVYYHDDERLVMAPVRTDQRTKTEPNGDRPVWETLQIRHQGKSRSIAEIIRSSLAGSASFDSVVVFSAPLAPLMGADLPAVLIEVGCFYPSAPLTEDQFEQAVNTYAKPIAMAIEAAISGTAP